AAVWHRSQSDGPRTYRVGLRSESRLPSAPEGRVDRLSMDVVSEAARRAGIRLEWVDTPEGPDDALLKKRIDLWPLPSIVPGRSPEIHITDPWLANARCLVTRGSPKHDWKDVPVAYGMGPTGVLTGNLPGARMVYKGNEILAIQAVCRGEAEGAFVS